MERNAIVNAIVHAIRFIVIIVCFYRPARIRGATNPRGSKVEFRVANFVNGLSGTQVRVTNMSVYHYWWYVLKSNISLAELNFWTICQRTQLGKS